MTISSIASDMPPAPTATNVHYAEVPRLTKLLGAQGLARIALKRAGADEIVTLTGLKTA